MKVWFKIQSFNRPFYKQTIIQDCDDVLKYIRHLYSTSSTPGQTNLSSTSSLLHSSSNKPKASLSLEFFNIKNDNQYSNSLQSPKSNLEKIVTVIDDEGSSQKVSMLALYPSSNLSSILFPKSVKADVIISAPQPQFISDILTKSKSRIFSESKSIPPHLFINQPNIISAVLEYSKPKEGQKSSTEKRSKILPVNDRIYIELLNQDVVSRVMDQDIAKSSGFQLEFKELFQFFTRKFDQLMIDKQLFSISLYALTSKFITYELSDCVESAVMKQQVPLTNQKYLYGLFSFFNQNQGQFWPYKQLCLMSILRMYDIFFDKCQYKLNIFLDQEKNFIQKIQAIVFLRLAEQTLGRDFQSVMYHKESEGSESFRFKGHIFRILMNSKDETRKLYKLPSMKWKFNQSFPQPKTSLEDLIELMSSIGFKMCEIASLLKNFSLVLNLGLVQFTQQSFLKQDQQRLYSRIVQTEAMGNIAALYSSQTQMIRAIILGQTNYKGESYQSIQLTSIKKQVLMRIIWEQAINRFATEMNAKVQNGQKDYSKMKRFQIFCHHNASLQDSKINEEVVIEDCSMQSFQYVLVGAKIAEKQFGTKSQISLVNNSVQIDTPSKLEKLIETQYIKKLESEFTSFNAKIIEKNKIFNKIYKQMRQLSETKQIVKEIFNSNKIQTSCNKYFAEFFTKEEPSQRLSENYYYICSDYWQFIHQEKEGPKVMDFFINLLKDQIQNLKYEEIPLQNQAQNSPKSNSVILPYSPSKSQAIPRSKQITHQIKSERSIKKEPSEKILQTKKQKQQMKSPVKAPFKQQYTPSNVKPINKLQQKPQTKKQYQNITQPLQYDDKTKEVKSELKTKQTTEQRLIPKATLEKQPQKIQLFSQKQSNISQSAKSNQLPHTQKPTKKNKKAPIPLLTLRKQSSQAPMSPSKQPTKPVTIGDVFRKTPKSSVLQSPRRKLIRIQLPIFVKKYLYGDELIQINRFFNSFTPNQSKTFQIQQVYKNMEKCITDLQIFSQLGQNQPVPETLQQLPLNQVNTAKQLLEYVLEYDDTMQNFFIEASPTLFNKIQAQNDLQKKSVYKIIRMFRTFKWVRNDRLYFFRKHFLAEIHRRCRFRNFVNSSFAILNNRYLNNLKAGFNRIKNKYRLSKLNEASNSIIASDTKHKKLQSLDRIKEYELKLKASQSLANMLQSAFQNVTSNVFRGLVADQYELFVTTPSGSKRNIDDLKINVENVNQTSITHPANTSTSNVKNLLSTNQKKNFSSKVVVPFDQQKFQQNTDPHQFTIQQEDQFDRSYTSSADNSSSQFSQKSGTQPRRIDEEKPYCYQKQKSNLAQAPKQQKLPEKSNAQQINQKTDKIQHKVPNPSVQNNQKTQEITNIKNSQPVKSHLQPTNLAVSQSSTQNLKNNPAPQKQNHIKPQHKQIQSKPPLPPPPPLKNQTQNKPLQKPKTVQSPPLLKPVQAKQPQSKPDAIPIKSEPIQKPAQLKPEPIKTQLQTSQLPEVKQPMQKTHFQPPIPDPPLSQQKQQPLPEKTENKTLQSQSVQNTNQNEFLKGEIQKQQKPQIDETKKQPQSKNIQNKPQLLKQQIKNQTKQFEPKENKLTTNSQNTPQQNKSANQHIKPEQKKQSQRVISQVKPQIKREITQQSKPLPPLQQQIKLQPKSNVQDKMQSPPSNNTNKTPQLKKPEEALLKNDLPKIITPQAQQTKNQMQKLASPKNQPFNELISVANSGLSGSMVSLKSQSADHIKKEELFQIMDTPFFSFESWAKDVGAIFPQKQKKACPILFRKYEEEKMKANEELSREIEEEKMIKEKIVNASFVSYLKENLNMMNDDPIESVLCCQKKSLEKPLLKHYDMNKHGDTFKTMFNCILKISLFKNTSQKLFELLNTIIKPIKDAYNRQKASIKTVFNDEPLMNSSYELDYNVLRDEMFLQLAKQIMGNNEIESTVSVIFSLQIITKYYCPSTKLFYAYLNHVRTNHVNKPDMFDKIYENLLKFSQAVEGYRGAKAKIYKNQVMSMTPVECNAYLEVRSSLFFNEECQIKDLVIRIEIYNRERFQFKVGNENLKTIKKKLLNELGFEDKQKNFGLYEQRGASNYTVIDQKQKAIDYLSKLFESSTKYRIILRVKHYYPIRFKDINSLRMFYLNMIAEQVRMPFKHQDYEHIVAMSISFNEFEQDRISNFLIISKKDKLMDDDLLSIKEKLQEMTKTESQKRICEFEYFKLMKEFKFLLAKVYKVTKEKQYFMDEVDRIVIKPKQLCMFNGTVLKSSLSLFRIKSFYYENNELQIDFIYSDRDLGDSYDKKFHGSVKNLVISDVYKIKELYDDIVYYTEMLHFGIKL